MYLRTDGRDGARAAEIRLAFGASDGGSAPEGVGLLAERRHFLTGGDERLWRRNVPSYTGVRYRGVHEGVDLWLRQAGERLEYDLLVEAGYDLKGFSISCAGSSGLALSNEGCLILETPLGALRQTPPVTWEVLPSGERRPVDCRFQLLGPDSYGFAVSGRNAALPMVVDPGLEWSTFLGGSLGDLILEVASTPQGDWIVAGITGSPNFPASAGAFDLTHGGSDDGFVAKLSADGSQLLWATYLGGGGDESLDALAVDSVGRPVIVGYTDSSSFPANGWSGPGWRRTPFGGSDGVLFRLATDGSDVEWCTYIGGSDQDELSEVVLAAGDEPVISGMTHSSDYPVLGASARPYAGGESDLCISRFDASGTVLLMSTCLGGGTIAREENAFALDLLPSGGGVVTAGYTRDPAFPATAGALDTSLGGVVDGCAAVIDLSTGGIDAATFLGGGGSAAEQVDSLVILPNGQIVLAGMTEASDFPTTPGAYDRSYADRGDVFVTGLTSALAGTAAGVPLYSTFLGTSGDEENACIIPGPAGSLIVSGSTNSAQFPTTLGAWDTVFNGAAGLDDGFVAAFNSSVSSLLHSTYLGGDDLDLITALASAGGNRVVVAGVTLSASFPVRNGNWDTSFNGFADAFLAQLDLAPCPILSQTPLQRGQPATFQVSEAMAQETVHLLYTLNGSGFGPAPGELGGLRLDLLPPLTLLGQPVANAGGVASLTLTIPPGAPLTTVWTQAAVRRGSGGALSLKSNVIAAAIQP
ncbi:MAG: hypothetical protein EYC70_05210 [Planctomycetota bacterium]|nr:MAG: hypothetical protein EYC70_05210 [Planctomycetota bacterium]